MRFWRSLSPALIHIRNNALKLPSFWSGSCVVSRPESLWPRSEMFCRAHVKMVSMIGFSFWRLSFICCWRPLSMIQRMSLVDEAAARDRNSSTLVATALWYDVSLCFDSEPSLPVNLANLVRGFETKVPTSWPPVYQPPHLSVTYIRLHHWHQAPWKPLTSLVVNHGNWWKYLIPRKRFSTFFCFVCSENGSRLLSGIRRLLNDFIRSSSVMARRSCWN